MAQSGKDAGAANAEEMNALSPVAPIMLLQSIRINANYRIDDSMCLQRD
jgi:hypothetical protein